MFIARMTMSALRRIVNGTIMPTMIPVRQPRNSTTTPRTTMIVSIMTWFILPISCLTTSAWKVTYDRSKPAGSSFSWSATRALSAFPNCSTLTGGHRNRHDDSGLAFVDGSRFRRIGWPHTHCASSPMRSSARAPYYFAVVAARSALLARERHALRHRQGCIDAADNNLSTRSDDVLFDELVDHPCGVSSNRASLGRSNSR